MRANFYKAYTLVEAIFVIGIFASVAAFLLPFALSQISGSRINESANEMESLIYLYRQNAYTGQNQSSYGVAFASNGYTLFQGDSLATATETEAHALPNGVAITGINLTNSSTEVVFSSGSFRPDESGTVVMSDGTSSYQLLINTEGLVDLQTL